MFDQVDFFFIVLGALRSAGLLNSSSAAAKNTGARPRFARGAEEYPGVLGLEGCVEKGTLEKREGRG